jgi:hypothetical protein
MHRSGLVYRYEHGGVVSMSVVGILIRGESRLDSSREFVLSTSVI